MNQAPNHPASRPPAPSAGVELPPSVLGQIQEKHTKIAVDRLSPEHMQTLLVCVEQKPEASVYTHLLQFVVQPVELKTDEAYYSENPTRRVKPGSLCLIESIQGPNGPFHVVDPDRNGNGNGVRCYITPPGDLGVSFIYHAPNMNKVENKYAPDPLMGYQPPKKKFGYPKASGNSENVKSFLKGAHEARVYFHPSYKNEQGRPILLDLFRPNDYSNGHSFRMKKCGKTDRVTYYMSGTLGYGLAGGKLAALQVEIRRNLMDDYIENVLRLPPRPRSKKPKVPTMPVPSTPTPQAVPQPTIPRPSAKSSIVPPSPAPATPAPSEEAPQQGMPAGTNVENCLKLIALTSTQSIDRLAGTTKEGFDRVTANFDLMANNMQQGFASQQKCIGELTGVVGGLANGLKNTAGRVTNLEHGMAGMQGQINEIGGMLARAGIGRDTASGQFEMDLDSPQKDGKPAAQATQHTPAPFRFQPTTPATSFPANQARQSAAAPFSCPPAASSAAPFAPSPAKPTKLFSTFESAATPNVAAGQSTSTFSFDPPATTSGVFKPTKPAPTFESAATSNVAAGQSTSTFSFDPPATTSGMFDFSSSAQ